MNDSHLKINNALVLGGLGFVGSNLAHYLMKNDIDVTLASRNNNKKYRLDEYENEAKVVNLDIRDYDKLLEIVSSSDYDVIFHLASQTSHSYSMENPVYDTEVNCVGTLNLLNAIKNLNSSPHIIYTSSKGVAGIPDKLPVNEMSPTNPLDVYSANKLITEEYFKIYNAHFDIPFTTFRLTNVFGPRQQISSPSLGILNFFIGQALQDRTIKIFGDGSQLRDYSYIDNVIDAFTLALSNSKAIGATYYLGSNIGTPFVTMAEKIVEEVGLGTIEKVEYPETAKKIEIGDFVVDYSKIKHELGWTPQIDFETGIGLTIDYYRERLEKYLAK